ncbi:MAG: GntR family transcriptional regulator [Lachnospiraceae bacterium]|nr:GntR family transcriptional regulator [Lachnospiraceae bacterium]
MIRNEGLVGQMDGKSIQTLVYEELKKNIISMKLEPGQTMSTQEIATKLNVSRTPVREAFLRLQSEGLVEMIPQRETMVSRIDVRRVSQEKFIRECLELGVIDMFLERRSQEHVRKMNELISTQKQCAGARDFVGFLEADDRFHKVLFDVAGQKMAWETIASRNGHYNRLRILYVQTEDVTDSSIRQHTEIVELLKTKEQERIRKAMASHIRRFDVDQAGLITVYPDYFGTREQYDRERRIGVLEI